MSSSNTEYALDLFKTVLKCKSDLSTAKLDLLEAEKYVPEIEKAHYLQRKEDIIKSGEDDT